MYEKVSSERGLAHQSTTLWNERRAVMQQCSRAKRG
jgi:hypothetical protein